MWEIRAARGEDASELGAVAREIFYDTFGPSNSVSDMEIYCSEEFTPEVLAGVIADPDTRILLAMHEGRIVGYAQIRHSEAPACVPGGPAIEMKRFYVLKAWHGTGLAGELLNAVNAKARAEGAEWLWLNVWEHNLRAIRFYEKCGFDTVGECPYVLGTDIQRDFIMAAPIDDLDRIFNEKIARTRQRS
ncbi:MAG: GCN5-related N-acetyltransferase [Chlorobi bacterium]|nr:GCN5-related N-acetyltransferase [Chlorobiota bacterium]